MLSATGAEVVQVTPAGAVPEAMAQESVTVPVKVAFGVRTMGSGGVPPAVTETDVEVLLLASVSVKSGVSAPVPLRADVIAVDEALVTTESCTVAAPLAVGVKTTLMAQVAPVASEVPQLLLAAKAPVAAMLVMVRGSLAGVGEGDDLSIGGDSDGRGREGQCGGGEGRGGHWRRDGEVADGGVVVGGACGSGCVVVVDEGEVGVEVCVDHVRAGSGEVLGDDEVVEDLRAAVFVVRRALIGRKQEREIGEAGSYEAGDTGLNDLSAGRTLVLV